MLGVILDLLLLFAALKHHHSRPGHNQGKDHLDVRPEAQQAGADGNEDPTEDDSANHPPVEYPVTILIRHAEPGEDRHHHEQVIDGEHLFQRVTGEEQARHFGTVMNVQEPGERHRHHHPED